MCRACQHTKLEACFFVQTDTQVDGRQADTIVLLVYSILQ